MAKSSPLRRLSYSNRPLGIESAWHGKQWLYWIAMDSEVLKRPIIMALLDELQHAVIAEQGPVLVDDDDESVPPVIGTGDGAMPAGGAVRVRDLDLPDAQARRAP